MKTTLSLAVVSMLAFAAPAFAQNAGAPGATGTGGSLTGSNTGTGFARGPGYYPDRPYYREDLNEGRAAAQDYGPDEGAPSYGWRPRAEEQGAGADLVGPGSNMDSPTDGHDVSR